MHNASVASHGVRTSLKRHDARNSGREPPPCPLSRLSHHANDGPRALSCVRERPRSESRPALARELCAERNA
eukprot:7355212-Prymnesium_polylepis.1